MPVPQQYQSIVTHLANVADKLKWTTLLVQGDLTVFSTKLDKVALTIWGDKRSPISASYKIQIKNDAGVSIDEFNVDEGEPLSDLLSSIHETARRKALDIDGTIDALNKSLERFEKEA